MADVMICAACSDEIAKLKHWLLCDQCQLTFHHLCAKNNIAWMPYKDYQQWKKARFPWKCLPCKQEVSLFYPNAIYFHCFA